MVAKFRWVGVSPELLALATWPTLAALCTGLIWAQLRGPQRLEIARCEARWGFLGGRGLGMGLFESATVADFGFGGFGAGPGVLLARPRSPLPRADMGSTEGSPIAVASASRFWRHGWSWLWVDSRGRVWWVGGH